MSMDEHEAAEQEFIQELTEEIIAEFQTDRLPSFFEARPRVAVPMFEVLDEARAFSATSHRATLVFAHAATEVCIQQVLARGMIYGFVHTEAAADLIAKTALHTAKLRDLKPMIAHVLSSVAQVDIEQEKLDEQKLWSATLAMQEKRNKIVHEGAAVTLDDAQRSMRIAQRWCDGIFVRVLAALKLGVAPDKSIQMAYKLRAGLPPLKFGP